MAQLLIDRFVCVLRFPFLGDTETRDITENGIKYEASLSDRRYLMENFITGFEPVESVFSPPRGYENHIRIKGNIDIQWNPTLPIIVKSGNPEKPLIRCPVVTYEKSKIEKFDNLNSIRFEFNPANANFSALRDFLYHLHMNFVKLKKKDFKVNRVDIAVDYHRKLDPYLFFNRARKYVIFGDFDKGTETLYLGNQRSEKFIRIYNKALEYKQMKGKKVRGDWWRVELVHQPHKGFSLFDDFKNPFSDLHYVHQDDIDYSTLPKSHRAWVRAILRCAKYSSITDAINDIFQDSDNKEKKRKRELMATLKSECPFDLPDVVFDRSWSQVYSTFMTKFQTCFDFIDDVEGARPSLVNWDELEAFSV